MELFFFDLGYSRAFKEVLRLQKILTPPSEFHRKQNTEELRQHIVAVEQLISNLPGGVALQLDQDLKIAVKGIVSKKRVENKPKPELFVEDDLLYV